MKAKLQKNKWDWHIYMPVVVVLLIVATFIIVVIFSDQMDWSNVFSVTPLLFVLVYPYQSYQITDNNQLMGNGVISIPFIQHVERKEKGGLRVYYVQMEGGKLRSHSFYPADEQLFIHSLLEINPNIKHN